MLPTYSVFKGSDSMFMYCIHTYDSWKSLKILVHEWTPNLKVILKVSLIPFSMAEMVCLCIAFIHMTHESHWIFLFMNELFIWRGYSVVITRSYRCFMATNCYQTQKAFASLTYKLMFKTKNGIWKNVTFSYFQISGNTKANVTTFA